MGSVSSEDLGDVWKRNMDRIDREIQADLHQYLANPEAGFWKTISGILNLEGDQMDGLKEILKNVSGGFKDQITGLKAASEAKNLGQIFQAIGTLVETAARVMEAAAKGLKESGQIISGPEKHETVKNLILDLVVGPVNAAVNLPFLGEEAEAALFRRILGGIIDNLIKQTVKRLNAAGWDI